MHLLRLILLSWPANGVREAQNLLLLQVAAILDGQASFRVHNLDALGDPVSIRGLCDIWRALFDALVVDAEFDLAFVDAAFDRPV